jgi:RNA polymerase sigma-70 factor (ECF subfamily)
MHQVQIEHIISGIKNGDEKSLKELYDMFKDKVFNLAISYSQNRQDAEEIIQDVFIEVFRSIDSFKGDSNISTWIYRITVNKSLDFIRYTKRKKRFAVITSLFNRETGEQIIEHSDFIHPGIEMEQKELSKYLFQAIEKLPESQKTAFLLSKIEGLSGAEISEIMKLSLSSVDSLLFRAKQNLKKLLSGIYDKL